eukprot:5963562-Prymnesium_polylepis.1
MCRIFSPHLRPTRGSDRTTSPLPEVTNPVIRSLTPPVVPSIRIKYHTRGHTERACGASSKCRDPLQPFIETRCRILLCPGPLAGP